MKIRSIKFGGTSMGCAEAIMESADIVASKSGISNIIVTVSAVSGITDRLINIIDLAKKHKPRLVNVEVSEIAEQHRKILDKIINDEKESERIWNQDFVPRIEKLKAITYSTSLVGDLTDKTFARICSFGEKLSSFFMVYALHKLSQNSVRIESEKVIRTNSDYMSAKVNFQATSIACRKILKRLLAKKMIPVVTGFIGKDTHGDITLLGRGGSDYTASILASAFDTEAVEIWTDVNGIMSADPRIVAKAKSWESLDMNLMSEMAYSGAKVLHPDTIVVAVRDNIPVYVYNTFNREFKGTVITKEKRDARGIVGNPDNMIVTLEDTSIINKIGFISSVGQVFERNKIPVDVCATSEISFSLSIKSNDYTPKLHKELSEIASVKIIKNVSKICIIGNDIAFDSEFISEVFKISADLQIKIHMISVSGTANNISMMIEDINKNKFMNAVHEKLVNV